jgi:hypothetical protein
MPEIYTCYYKRPMDTIEGVFSLKRYNTITKVGTYVFEKLGMRSGQIGHEATDWIRGKSGTPRGSHIIWLDYALQPGKLPEEDPQTIGEFWNISTSKENRSKIWEPGKGERWDIGAHLDNDWSTRLFYKKGSAGCPVFKRNTSFELMLAWNVMYFFRNFRKYTGQIHMPFVVFE